MSESHAEHADAFIAAWAPDYALSFDGVYWHARRPHGPHLQAISASKLREMLIADRSKRDRNQGMLDPDPATPTDQGSL